MISILFLTASALAAWSYTPTPAAEDGVITLPVSNTVRYVALGEFTAPITDPAVVLSCDHGYATLEFVNVTADGVWKGFTLRVKVQPSQGPRQTICQVKTTTGTLIADWEISERQS